MTPLACARIISLLERRAVGLSDSERLLTESHLTECESCRAQSQLLEGVRQALGSSGTDAVLSPLARELTLKRAFELAAAPPVSVTKTSIFPRPWRLATGALLAAAAALLLLGFWRGADTTSRARGDVVEAGQVTTSQGVLEAGAELPAQVPLSVASAARLHVGRATVNAAPLSRLTWQTDVDTLSLAQGELTISVEHAAGRHFRVAAPSFLVEVVGTEFKVDLQSVHVSRGLVRVLSTDGQQLLALLPAGGAWSAPIASTVARDAGQQVARAAPSPSVIAPANDASANDSSPAHPAAVESTAQRLSAARRALADGRIGEAEKLADAAIGAHASSRELAEGKTLLAECAIARGNSARAVQLYLEVAKAFPGLAAGENALFAGARLSERVGPSMRARALFEQYLATYPTGRFRQEAERHLRSHDAPSR